MSQFTQPSTLTGLFKEAYGDDVINLVPESAKLIREVKFTSADKESGNKYHQPVVLSNEHGVTYAAFDAGAFSLNSSISMTMQDAQVSASQTLLRTVLSYDAAARASNNKKAFVKATELIVENMMESISKRVEISCFYGNTGIGLVASSVNINATSTTLQFSTASWATGIWAGSENATLNFYTLGGVLVSTGADSIFTIVSVDIDLRKVVVSGTATGITALDIAAAATVNAYFNGAKGSEMTGIDGILTNTGTLFNISASAYNLWKGNTYSSASAQLTMGKLLSGVSKAVQRGLNEEVDAWLNPTTWANVMSDLAALRRFDGSYDKKQLESGTQAIKFYGQNGAINIISHNIIKEGEAFVVPPKRLTRVGAQDISFKTPGRDEEIFTQAQDRAGYELRVYTDQAIFLETPARAVKITNIVNV